MAVAEPGEGRANGERDRPPDIGTEAEQRQADLQDPGIDQEAGGADHPEAEELQPDRPRQGEHQTQQARQARRHVSGRFLLARQILRPPC